ncbi:amino acid permease 8 [Ricinus communis]|uniref:Amino acid transporter, putative n=1 Tax=Ricinus communis TaxID=3988 RepID=B9RS12_RICCO|nr:amino acid permease 8 [Ricinus communis]EEF45872.1 amino acid transporter, putative [Ricinus communis]|eukprot:XP_002516531.1 amino acid permease 8 [Ricinus communis]
MVSLVEEGFEGEFCEGVGSTLASGKLSDNGELDDDGKPRRTGTVWTASAHIITAIIGSGVLSLAWAMAQMGWIAGIATLLIFSFITLYTSGFLADSYRSPDPVTGKRNYTYMEAVKANLGGNMYKLCGLVQYTYMGGLAVGYTITSAICIVALLKSNCFYKRGHGAPCKYSSNPYMIGMGVVEIVLSQIPNLHEMSWLSFLASLMSFGYASIGIGLALAKIISGKRERSTLTGVEIGVDLSQADKIWTMLRAIGDMAFACSYAGVLIEIQDTLKSSPPENKVMKKANTIAILTSTAFYVMCGCLGYAALGNRAPGNLLTDFGFSEPFWLIDIANIFVVLHLIGAYQVLSQPVLNVVETWAIARWPKSKFVTNEYPISIGKQKLNISVNLLRLTWRSAYVVIVTVIAMVLPFFNDILALLGAIGYWPMAVYFPVEMHIAQKKIQRQTVKWFCLQLMNLICLIVSIAAACGAIQGLDHSLQTHKLFKF